MDKHNDGDIGLIAFLRLNAYIRRVVRNEKSNYFRELSRRMEHETRLDDLPGGTAALVVDDYAEETFCAVESELEIMGLRFSVEEPLYSELTALDPDSFKVVAMTHWLGMGTEAISAVTGINPRRVRRIRNRVYKRLREKLEGL